MKAVDKILGLSHTFQQSDKQQQQQQWSHPPLNCCSDVSTWLDLLLCHHLSMALLKNIYSLSQPSPTKAACRHGTPFVGANETNLHHYSLSHHPFLFSPSMQSYLFTSLGQHICHVTEHIHMDMCKYNPVKYELSCMSPDVTFTFKLFSCLNLSLIISWWHVPSLCSFSLCRACHVTDDFHLCSCRHNSILQPQPVIFYLHCQYTFVFDAILSFSILNFATSSSAQPPLSSEMHIQLLLPHLTCS